MAVVPGTELPSPRRGGRPRDPSRDEAIRAALLRLRAEVGYGGLTMDAVAEEAGVGKATIYRRWRTLGVNFQPSSTGEPRQGAFDDPTTVESSCTDAG